METCQQDPWRCSRAGIQPRPAPLSFGQFVTLLHTLCPSVGGWAHIEDCCVFLTEWSFKKLIIYLLIHLLLYFLAVPHSIWDPTSLTRDGTCSPPQWKLRVLTQRTIREYPRLMCLSLYHFVCASLSPVRPLF